MNNFIIKKWHIATWSVPSPGQLQPHAHNTRNFLSPPWHTLKAMAYVSPTMPAPDSTHPALGVGIRLPSKSSGPSAVGRGIVPRPTSVIGIGAVLHCNISQPVRRYMQSHPLSPLSQIIKTHNRQEKLWILADIMEFCIRLHLLLFPSKDVESFYDLPYLYDLPWFTFICSFLVYLPSVYLLQQRAFPHWVPPGREVGEMDVSNSG